MYAVMSAVSRIIAFQILFFLATKLEMRWTEKGRKVDRNTKTILNIQTDKFDCDVDLCLFYLLNDRCSVNIITYNNIENQNVLNLFFDGSYKTYDIFNTIYLLNSKQLINIITHYTHLWHNAHVDKIYCCVYIYWLASKDLREKSNYNEVFIE